MSIGATGMRLWLEFSPDMAVLHILDGDERTEVRGHPRVGAVYEGGRLDRIINGLGENNFNVSVLFAGDVLHVRSGGGGPIRELLRREEEMVSDIFSSKMAKPPRKNNYKKPTKRDMARLRAVS